MQFRRWLSAKFILKNTKFLNRFRRNSMQVAAVAPNFFCLNKLSEFYFRFDKVAKLSKWRSKILNWDTTCCLFECEIFCPAIYGWIFWPAIHVDDYFDIKQIFKIRWTEMQIFLPWSAIACKDKRFLHSKIGIWDSRLIFPPINFDDSPHLSY